MQRLEGTRGRARSGVARRPAFQSPYHRWNQSCRHDPRLTGALVRGEHRYRNDVLEIDAPRVAKTHRKNPQQTENGHPPNVPDQGESHERYAYGDLEAKGA